MTHSSNTDSRWQGFSKSKLISFGAALLIGVGPVQYSSAAVSQVPLYLGGGGVPGNLVLTPSVEFPTIQSLANLGNYAPNRRFEGYFDPEKCYQYDYVAENDSANHFYPSSVENDRTCSGDGEWSGNFLNWAVTQTIDPFRKVLTGGYRVKDTPTETWLEKARHPGQSNISNRVLSGTDLVKGATPFDSDKITVRIKGLNKDMRFSLGQDSVESYEVQYDPENFPQTGFEVDTDDGDYWEDNFSYRAAVRVKVCDPSVGLENNCKKYRDSWKPEGVLQQNAERIRYSVFGYLNQDGSGRDGGVMRARQKYIGPQKFVGGSGFIDNPNKEWNPVTGELYTNPNPNDASATPGTVINSGVINYINKFGQLNNYNHKSNDPVSELYYAATRYLKNQGNVASYSSLSGSNVDKYTDGFPVIATWDDPIQFECQPNVILGIGDVNTHDDGNLPGTSYRGDEPILPSEVRSDSTVNVTTMTNKVGSLEGIGSDLGEGEFTGRENTAYIAGLAYHNRTVDMRDDLAGKQTASTHWVDVLENTDLLGTARNQYYLAAKYGGFDVPDDFDPLARTTALPEEWWHTSGETVSWDGTSFKRPDNFYIAGQADRMIESLREAFKNISSELSSSSSSIAANSTSLENETAVYQASFNSARWSGELVAYQLQGTDISPTPIWQVSDILDAKTDVQMDSRNILTAQPMTESSGVFRTTTGSEFDWAGLTIAQRAALAADGEGGSVSSTVAQDRLDYLRGKRVNERTDGNQIRPFRQRDGRLGDIINSSPVYVHRENFGYYLLNSQPSYTGISSYADFRDSTTYKTRPPFLLVGANDGMLHAFDASVSENSNGGEELFAYVPAGVYGSLWELTDPNYSHRYYVDGTPAVSDAWLGSSLGWRTLAVGTTGAGGRSVFALDVTDPEGMTTTDVLWEFSHEDLGLTMQKPAVFALATGKFGVAVSSGYDTDLVNGKVWFLDASSGQVTKEISIPTNGAELGSPLLIDVNADRIADRMYVADTAGSLWRVDIDDSSVANWQEPGGLSSGGIMQPLFEASAGQSITADLSAALNENGEIMVFFGTGSFQNVGDNVVGNSPVVESFYGIIDRGVPVARNTLLEQEILDEVTSNGNRLRLVSKNQPSESYNGWFIDLLWKSSNGGTGAEGERVVSQAIVRSDRVIFPTLIPSEDPCEAGGNSWLMEVELYSGGQLNYEVFDINNDGDIDDSDRIPGDDDDGDGDPEKEPPSGIDPDIGIIQKPTIIEDCVGGDECKIVSGSSGNAEVIQEKGIAPVGRINWEQLR
ncbi:MAG TPA: PilC/PilY family type IV pilus protein [Marinobacter sp.]|uniref:pilus assembly protein n=1 Tax=Marinobacter sp. TaxID=50741 RepID=UPI002D80BB16|nr:PilC/PilY family type IV pilus protein [Marinobacter sp.]HET8801861.1 PilC/PilY family type IV pilus protein [Marinobacter sp.]